MATEKTISVGQMLVEMQTGTLFSIIVVSYDKERKKGGQKKEYHEAKLLGRDDSRIVSNPNPNAKDTKTRKDSPSAQTSNPKHAANFTRNLVICVDGMPTSEIRKFHPPLVLTYNGMTVTAKDARDSK